MKQKFIPIVAIFLVFILFLSACASKQSSSPEGTMKIVLDGIMKGNYEAAFAYMIDDKGNPLSEQTKQMMVDSMKRTPYSAYKILETKDLSSAGISLPEYYKNSPLIKDAKVVRFTITEKESQKTQESTFIMSKQGGSWKILLPQST